MSFQLVHAAVRRRKPVFVLDVTADPALPGRLAAVCAAAGAPLQVFGDPERPALRGPRAGPGRPAMNRSGRAPRPSERPSSPA